MLRQVTIKVGPRVSEQLKQQVASDVNVSSIGSPNSSSIGKETKQNIVMYTCFIHEYRELLAHTRDIKPLHDFGCPTAHARKGVNHSRGQETCRE